ncbi:PTS sugar transporter subunit IIA [Altererythrobacter sp.]|uniref:PTS sugar transporter subunit IIA n=1 Tax=Altererythrobacter sp. TaxID=1872480 RepID=UPI001B23BA7B|nr:PTS sugar transporter subunit IIA [Altererythrobacter sp.]MBO6609406.1 PTS sugar transporter subunit IIA [Altererythrobacter sp.]MBO6642273.1 PTS sugar transporter subunit IIA [Altererythrobacter sp.]MBO6709219.1 PTS sugar transporter subunit IIA [Altererythrobacter sp.]
MNANFQLLPAAVATDCLASKELVLQRVGALFADCYNADASDVLDGLEEREKLGSTGFGNGVAIPHARSPLVNRPVAVLLRLESPVDFAAADGMPVDLIFGLLSPDDAGAGHLHALAAISRLARDDNMRDALIEAPDTEAMYALLSSRLERDAA